MIQALKKWVRERVRRGIRWLAWLRWVEADLLVLARTNDTILFRGAVIGVTVDHDFRVSVTARDTESAEWLSTTCQMAELSEDKNGRLIARRDIL